MFITKIVQKILRFLFFWCVISPIWLCFFIGTLIVYFLVCILNNDCFDYIKELKDLNDTFKLRWGLLKE